MLQGAYVLADAPRALSISIFLAVIILAMTVSAFVARRPHTTLRGAFASLRSRLARAVDILLLRDYYAFGPTLQRFSQELALLRDQDEVINLLLNGLSQTLNLSGIAFVQLPEGLEQRALRVIEPDDLRALGTYTTVLGRAAVLHGLASLNLAEIAISWQSPLLRDPWPGCAALVLVGQATGDDGAALLIIGSKRSGARLWRDDQALLVTLAHQAATALANAVLVAGLKTSLAQVRISTEQLVQARAEQQLLLRELVNADERQRAALAHDLHDDALQEVLYLIRHSRLCTELAEILTRAEVVATNSGALPMASGSRPLRSIDTTLVRLRQEILQLTERSTVIEQKLRSLYMGLYPALLPSLGLPVALEDLARELAISTGLDIHVSYDDDARIATETLGQEASLHIYRIAQEALRNAAKHTATQTATLRLRVVTAVHEHPVAHRSVASRSLHMEVQDGGQGMRLPVDYASLLRDGHLGLAGMRERAERIGATLDIQAAPAGGSCVCLNVPLVANEH